MQMQKKCEMSKSALPGLVLALGFVPALIPAAVSEADLARQEALALEYRWNIDRAPSSDAATREALFLRLIEECPETEAAERAYWALSNLYLDDFDEPREDDARKILERFVERYASSRWIAHATDRLAWLWGEKRP